MKLKRPDDEIGTPPKESEAGTLKSVFRHMGFFKKRQGVSEVKDDAADVGESSAAFESETFAFEVNRNGKWRHYPRGTQVKISEAYKKGKDQVDCTVVRNGGREVHTIHFATMTQTIGGKKKDEPNAVRVAVESMLGGKLAPQVGEDPPNTTTNPSVYIQLFPPYIPMSLQGIRTEQELQELLADEKINVTCSKRFRSLRDRSKELGCSSKFTRELDTYGAQVEALEKAYTGLDAAPLLRAAADCKHLKGPLIDEAKNRSREMTVATTRYFQWAQYIARYGRCDLTHYSKDELLALETEVIAKADAFGPEFTEAHWLRACAARIEREYRRGDTSPRNGSTSPRGGSSPRKESSSPRGCCTPRKGNATPPPEPAKAPTPTNRTKLLEPPKGAPNRYGKVRLTGQQSQAASIAGKQSTTVSATKNRLASPTPSSRTTATPPSTRTTATPSDASPVEAEKGKNIYLQLAAELETKKTHAVRLRTKKPEASMAVTRLGASTSASSTAMPSYWTRNAKAAYAFYPIPMRSDNYQVFRDVLCTDKPNQLNKGRDVKEKGEYTKLDLVGAWRLENRKIWHRYADERMKIRDSLRSRGIRAPHFHMRRFFYDTLKKLPGYEKLYDDINETYLIHGTLANWILPIAQNGINPPKGDNAALFGKGIYFAEDCAKNDQYVIGDAPFGSHHELHNALFPAGGEFSFPKTPYKAYYLILCRVIVGYAVNVTCTDSERRTMINNHHAGQPIFPDDGERELANIPGIENPPMRYHCLIASKGGAIVRFREFCQFHGNRVYPEYLICYSRK